jgi:hypothetical protein
MPQLDLVTFFPQFFWCFVCFFFLFFFFSYSIIPKIAITLKFRKKKLTLLANEINKKKDSSSRLLKEYDQVFCLSFQEATQMFDKLLQLSHLWSQSSIKQFNTTQFLSINKRLLQGSFEKDYMIYRLILLKIVK